MHTASAAGARPQSPTRYSVPGTLYRASERREYNESRRAPGVAHTDGERYPEYRQPQGIKRIMPGLGHARRRSFLKHSRLLIHQLPIDNLEEKHRELLRVVHTPLRALARGCVRLPSYAKCPRSFGNMHNVLVSAMITAHVLQAPVQSASPMDCGGLLHVKLGSRQHTRDDGRVRRGITLDAQDVCNQLGDSGFQLSAGDCITLPVAVHGQETPWCLQQRKQHTSNDTTPLFALGPHAAYGAVFDANFALVNETTPEWRDDEIRISVHIRHFESHHKGGEGIDAYESAIRVAAKKATRCAILLASDRRLTLQLMQDVALRVGCRLLQSARGLPQRDYSAEHGDDVGAVVLHDVFLLAHGHVLIGTWASTLTVAVQEMIAARSIRAPHAPTVTYCDVEMRGCIPPLPLLTEEGSHWYITIGHSTAPHIVMDGEMRRVVESRNWLGQSQQALRWRAFPSQANLDQWPTSDEAVNALGRLDAPHGPAGISWTGAIISAKRSSRRYAVTASSIRSVGFLPVHIPAAMPSHYATIGEMMEEAFGNHKKVAVRMSAQEVGLVISHKRALLAIATGPYAWGAVFEDDAYLHESVTPTQAAVLIQDAFALAKKSTLLYLGACGPQCAIRPGDPREPLVGNYPDVLIRGGQCRAYCTHAYALARRYAATFFADVFGCSNGTASCGKECEHKPCFTDWAFNRYLTRGNAAWIIGGGLHGRWMMDHTGLFLQNRSSEFGNNVKGTSLRRAVRWKGPLSDAEAEAERERRRCHQLVGADDNVTRHIKLRIAIKWSGRTGNLMFEAAALLGIAARLRAIAPDTEIVTLNLPSSVTVPARMLFEQFPRLTRSVHIANITNRGSIGGALGDASLDRAYAIERQQCRACSMRLEEDRANAHEEGKLRVVEAWLRHPPDGCSLALLDLSGYFQSFKYFNHVAEPLIYPAFAETAAATQRNADSILAAARNSLPASGRLVGVQVRLGDKVRGPLQRFYAQTDWEYYRVAMRFIARKLSRHASHARRLRGTSARDASGSTVGFVITAGGTMGNSSFDVAQARLHLSSVSKHVTFSTSSDPYVDLAVLRGCDGLVISASSLGWWAAYLSQLPPARVISPLRIYHTSLPSDHKLVKGFKSADYFPPDWLLLANDGMGNVVDNTGGSVSMAKYSKMKHQQVLPNANLMVSELQEKARAARARIRGFNG